MTADQITSKLVAAGMDRAMAELYGKQFAGTAHALDIPFRHPATRELLSVRLDPKENQPCVAAARAG